MTMQGLREFLVGNRFSTKTGIRHLLALASNGSLKYFMTTFQFYSNRLQSYQQLDLDAQLVSDNGYLNLIMQTDGNLVLYRTMFRKALWASGTYRSPVDYAIMQGDGDLAAYSSGGTRYWNTGTGGNPGAFLLLQDDGNLVVYDAVNRALWASNTVQDFRSPTFQYSDSNGYNYDETSEWWKNLCTIFPCFAALHWPGYSTTYFTDTINNHPVVIQLWKGYCPKFLGLSQFPGGIGAEVGVYRFIPGKLRPNSAVLSFLPKALADLILNSISNLADTQLWWAYPELGTEISFTLTNPKTGQTFFDAGPETTYWLTKWMDLSSYAKYVLDQKWHVPLWPTDYVLNYTIAGKSYGPW